MSPTVEVFADIEQRSDSWYAIRRGMLTASAVNLLLTPTLKVASNDTSRGLIATLAAERITGWSEPTFTSDDMWRGIEHEPIARSKYAEHHAPVTEVGFIVRTIDGCRLGYSPDGLVGDNGLIEIKCPRAKSHVQTIARDNIPTQYIAQLQAGLFVTGRDWIDYVSFCAGLPLYVKRMEPIGEWQDAIRDALLACEASVSSLVAEFEHAAESLYPTERIEELVI
jgi:hypothetical protein